MPINAYRARTALRRLGQCGGRLTKPNTLLLVGLCCAMEPAAVAGQTTAADAVAQRDSVAPADSVEVIPSGAVVVTPAPAGGLPLFLTIGAGYGQRSDPCSQCTAPENTDSFTGHLSVGKYLAYGLGIGVDASVWRRGHPGPRLAPDSLGVSASTTLANTLGNASLSLSLQTWHVFVRGGIGLAWGSQDFETLDLEGDPTVLRASGKGIGYSAGGGLTVPLASMVSLAVFANWNNGSYDLASPEGILQRDSEHKYVEVGFGLTIR